MNKIVVLYKSKYGATKQYAQLLKEKLNCDIWENKNVTVAQLQPYDTIILGGGIYAGGIAGRSFLEKHYQELKHKQLLLFGVGASPYDENALKALRLKSELKDIPLFYCRGAWNESVMSFKDKTLCSMLKKMVAKKDPATYEPWEAALAEAMQGGKFDWTDETYLTPILNYINQHTKNEPR